MGALTRWRYRPLPLILCSWCAAVSAASDVGCQSADTCLAEVVVTATRDAHPRFDLPVAIDVVDGEQLRDQRLGINLSETLNRVAGVAVQNRETYAQEQQVTLRGFGARSQFGVRGIKVLVDGIPASMPDGQGSTGLFDLTTAKSIEIMRGGFSSLYGNHSGGVIQITTEDGSDAPTYSFGLDAGSFATLRETAQFGGTSGALNYIGSVSRLDTGGYRDWSRARKDQSNVKLKWAMDEDTTITLVGNYLDQPDSRDPLGLTALEMAADPRRSSVVARQFETRRSLDNLQGGLSMTHKINAHDSLFAFAYSGQRNNEQYLAIPLSAQNALTSSGGVGAFDRDFHGAGLRWHRSLAATSMTVGVDYEAAQDERKGWLNNNGTKGALKRNETDKVSQTGTYFQGEQYLSSNWIASSGVRYTRVAFDSRDHFICTAIGSSCSGSSQMVTASNFNPDDSGATEFTAWTGALGLVYKLAPAINLYANAGRSFETPTFIELAYRPNNQAGLNLALRDSRSRQYEIGLKTSLAADTRLNAALFHIDTANEIVVDTSLGGRSSYRNAGESRRQGMEISIDGAMGRYLSGYASATVIDAVFAEGFNGSGGPVAAGNRLPGVARYNAYGEIVWRDPSDCLSTAFEVRLSDRVMVNDINSEAATGYTTASWRIGINQTIGAWLFSGFLRVDNLFDRQYAGAIYVNDANGRFYAPAPGRSYLLGASFTMGY